MHRFRLILPVAALAALAACAGSTGITGPSSTPSTSSSSTAVPDSSTSTSPAQAEPSTSTSSDPAEKLSNLRAGQKVTAHGVDDNGTPFEMTITLVATKKAKAIDEYTVSTKGEFLGAQVQYQCTKGTCTYNVFDWNLRNADGDSMDQSSGFDPSLNSGTLHKGVKARGWITWDVKPGQRLALEYQVNPINQDVASWNVKS